MSITGLHRLAPPAWPFRLIAAAAAALVLALTVLAASPQLHKWLHPDADDSDHECAITLFHHGVAQAATAIILAVVSRRWIGFLATIPAALNLVAPRFRLSPGRGPPVC
jgi:hypothetical protein